MTPTHAKQLELDVTVIDVDRPSCRLCDRPAAWNGRQQQWAAYCTPSQGCSSRVRNCRHPGCGVVFTASANGAGRTRCASHRTVHWVAGKAYQCDRCGKFAPDQRAHDGGLWPYLCAECRKPLRHVEARLKRHHVPWDTVRPLLDNGACPMCDTDMLEPVTVRTPGTASWGKRRPLLVVDHDHACCPNTSCGRCVRGLICTTCNTALGLMRDDPGALRRLAEYIERVKFVR